MEGLAPNVHSVWRELTLNMYSGSVFPGGEISEWPQSSNVNILNTAVPCNLVIGKFNVVFSQDKKRETI